MIERKPIRKVEREQFNVRILPPLRRVAAITAAALNWSEKDICEVALQTVFGSKDPLVIAQRDKIRDTVSKLRLSFNPREGQHFALTE